MGRQPDALLERVYACYCCHSVFVIVSSKDYFALAWFSSKTGQQGTSQLSQHLIANNTPKIIPESVNIKGRCKHTYLASRACSCSRICNNKKTALFCSPGRRPHVYQPAGACVPQVCFEILCDLCQKHNTGTPNVHQHVTQFAFVGRVQDGRHGPHSVLSGTQNRRRRRHGGQLGVSPGGPEEWTQALQTG